MGSYLTFFGIIVTPKLPDTAPNVAAEDEARALQEAEALLLVEG